MKELKVNDWFIFGEWYDVFWFHSSYVDGLAFTIKEKLGYGLSQIVVEQNKNIQSILFSRAEWTDVGKRWLEEVVKDHDKLIGISKELHQASDELNEFSIHLKNLNIDSLTQKELIELLIQYNQKHSSVWKIGMITNVLELENSFLTDYLKDWLKNKGLDSKELVNIFQILITPRELSATQKEEREMLNLATFSNADKEIVEHWQKYSWLHFGWTGPSLSLEYFQKVHKGLFSEGVREKLQKILAEDKQLMENKNFFIEKLNIPKDIVDLFRQMEELLFMKVYRMDALFKSYEAIQPLLKKFAKLNFLSLQQIYNSPIEVFLKMLEEYNIDSHLLNELGEYSVRYFDGDKIYLLLGDEAKRYCLSAKSALPKSVVVNELKGECAYPGLVTGQVVIVNRAEEMKKFNEGDILVSNVTDPSLLPIMKKVSAFVTNQGGLACHAAILAREMKKPCITGTRIATKILKDGDLVEVDANLGIVKKIKQN